MWTRPSEGSERRGPRLEIKRTSRQFDSHQSGARCALHSWSVRETRRHLIFVHGALSHSQRHVEMFEWMIRRLGGGLAVHGLDLVGHGTSTGPRGHAESFAVFIEDLLKTMRLLQIDNPEAEFWLMGHSLGGLVVLKTILESEQRLPFWPKGLLLANPCVRPHKVIDFPKVEEALEQFSRRLPQFRFPRLHKGRALALNAQAANEFDTDPLIPSFMTARLAWETWRASEDLRALSYFIKLPTLFLVSEEDQVVSRDATLLFARGIDKKWSHVREYRNAAHEILHENIRQKVWRDVVDWIQAHGDAK